MPNLLLHTDNYGEGRGSDLARDVRFDGDPVKAAEALRRDCYVVVATFEGDDPWEAYRLSQNGVGTPSWSRSPLDGVTPVGTGMLTTPRGDMGYRSSMVGDAVVIDGAVSVLGRVDFKPVHVILPDVLRGVDGSEVATAPPPQP